MLGKGSYRGVVLGQLTTDPTRTRAGAAVGRQWLEEDRQSTVEKVSKSAGEVVTFLVEGLRDKVYRNVDVIMINHSRRLLGVSSDMVRIKTSGAVAVSTLTWRSFRSAARGGDAAAVQGVLQEAQRRPGCPSWCRWTVSL